MPLRQVRYIYPCPSIIILQLPDFLTSRNRSQSVPPIRPTPFLTWSIYAFFFSFSCLFVTPFVYLCLLRHVLLSRCRPAILTYDLRLTLLPLFQTAVVSHVPLFCSFIYGFGVLSETIAHTIIRGVLSSPLLLSCSPRVEASSANLWSQAT